RSRCLRTWRNDSSSRAYTPTLYRGSNTGTPPSRFLPREQMTKQAKTVILDIETCAIQAHVWGLWNQNVSLNMIQEDWRLLSFAAKELGDDRITYLEARHPNQERKVLRAIWRILNEADIVVAHNGKKFDIKKINARL